MRRVSCTGRLLVATPVIGDSNFERTVVLILEHEEEGAFGLVLNRPTDLDLLDLLDPLPQWYSYAARPSVVFVGGPVEQERAIALALADGDRTATGWNPVLGRVGTLDLSCEPHEIGPGLEEIRVFAGYAGWGAGQLEAEVEAGAWFIVDATPDDAMCDEPVGLWADVLRRQGGNVALFANYPENPEYN